MIRFIHVPNSHCVILERWGKYSRTLKTGLKFYIMGLEKIKRLDVDGSHWGDDANKEHYFIELAEQNTTTSGSKAYTKDNVEVSVDASVFWQIVDAKKAVYESDCLPLAVKDRAVGVLRASIGVFDFDELSTKREQLSKETTEALIESGKKWGVKFTRVEIQQLQTDGKTQEALLQQVEADRRKKAIIAEAEGKKVETELNAEAKKLDALMAAEAEEQVQVLQAKGKKEAISLESQGKADQILNIARAQAEALALTKDSEKEYLREMSEIVGPTEAARLLMAQKYVEGFENISKNPSNKVFLPNNFNAAFNLGTDNAPAQPAPAPAPTQIPQKEEIAPPKSNNNDAGMPEKVEPRKVSRSAPQRLPRIEPNQASAAAPTPAKKLGEEKPEIKPDEDRVKPTPEPTGSEEKADGGGPGEKTIPRKMS